MPRHIESVTSFEAVNYFICQYCTEHLKKAFYRLRDSPLHQDASKVFEALCTSIIPVETGEVAVI